jgi:hypothetical protein
MARRAAGSWPEYIRELLNLWDVLDLGADFKVGNFTRADLEELQRNIEDALRKIAELERALGFAITERETVIRDLEKFGVQFRLAVALKYGLQSPEVRMVPTVAAPPKGTRRKKAEEETEDTETGDERHETGDTRRNTSRK